MAKFIIACPVCGNYSEGKTGFFAKKKIQCACGNVIDVKADKMSVAECPHCANQIIYDQTKGTTLRCPVCRQSFDTRVDQSRVFTCGQCGVRLAAAPGERIHACPVCDYVNNVAERLTAAKVRKDGTPLLVRWEGDNSTFVWKYPAEDFNPGSQLLVHESQEAIFFRDGQALDLFSPGRPTLDTPLLPLLEKAGGAPADAEGAFHTEIYFINKTVQMGIKWGTPEKVRFIDPLTGTPLQLGASGEMNLQVSDARRLLVKLAGTMKGIAWEDGPGLAKSLQACFRPLIASSVKVALPAVINRESIDILEIDTKLDVISESLRKAILPGFEEYGLTVPQLFVTNVVLPEEDPNFKRIRELHTVSLQAKVYQAEATVLAAKAQSETMYRTAEEQSKAAVEAARRLAVLQQQDTETEIAKREAERLLIQAQAEAQAKRMAGMAEADVMQAKGYNQKDVMQAEIQKAYAEHPAVPQQGVPAGSFVPAFGQGPAQQAGTWDCACGQKGNTGNFCSNCGTRRPVSTVSAAWDCECGQKGITGNFCPNCGRKRPEAKPAAWDCVCGRKGITGNFCDNCGRKREG